MFPTVGTAATFLVPTVLGRVDSEASEIDRLVVFSLAALVQRSLLAESTVDIPIGFTVRAVCPSKRSIGGDFSAAAAGPGHVDLQGPSAAPREQGLAGEGTKPPVADVGSDLAAPGEDDRHRWQIGREAADQLEGTSACYPRQAALHGRVSLSATALSGTLTVRLVGGGVRASVATGSEPMYTAGPVG